MIGRNSISVAARISVASSARITHALPRARVGISVVRPSSLRPQHRAISGDFHRRLLDEIRTGGLARNWLAISTFTILISTTIGTAAYYIYLYHELVEKPLSIYPTAVTAKIKTALYYASHGETAKMVGSFKAAITAAEELGMHPLSDEVAGLKIECAQLLLKTNDSKFTEKAVEVLEHVLDEAAAGADYFAKEKRWKDYTKVLKRAILLGYKIGEIYQGLGKDGNAEEAMSWSTEKLLKEMKRREDVKVNQEEGDWFDDVTMSACFEKLAQQYDQTAQYYLAVPLYVKAITMIPSNSCHVVTLMNNLAAALSRQNLPQSEAKITREHLLSDAQKWAEKALELDATIKPPLRTEECDHACVAASHNLGEIAQLMGNKELAIRRFNEALSLAEGLGMVEGIEAAQEGLTKVGDTNEKRGFV